MTVGYSEWTGVMTYIESKYITKYMEGWFFAKMNYHFAGSFRDNS